MFSDTIYYCETVVLQLGTLYQQPFETYDIFHHHPVSAAISKLNYLAGRMALTHRATFMIAYSYKNGRTKIILLTRTYLLEGRMTVKRSRGTKRLQTISDVGSK